MPSVIHCTDQYANNRAEVSHQPTRQREGQKRGFKSATQLQRFASVHGAVQYLFRSADTFCGLLVAIVRAFFRDLRSPPQSRN